MESLASVLTDMQTVRTIKSNIEKERKLQTPRFVVMMVSLLFVPILLANQIIWGCVVAVVVAAGAGYMMRRSATNVTKGVAKVAELEASYKSKIRSGLQLTVELDEPKTSSSM